MLLNGSVDKDKPFLFTKKALCPLTTSQSTYCDIIFKMILIFFKIYVLKNIYTWPWSLERENKIIFKRYISYNNIKLTWCPSLFKDNFPKNQDELQTLQIVHIYIHTHILNTIYCLYCSNTNYSRVRVTVTLTNDWWSQGLQSITPHNAILET